MLLWAYLIGSACFFVSSFFQLLMWKNESFGLAFIHELNAAAASADAAAADAAAAAAGGAVGSFDRRVRARGARVSPRQLCFVYATIATTSCACLSASARRRLRPLLCTVDQSGTGVRA